MRELADGRLVPDVRPPQPARREPADVPAKLGDDRLFSQPRRRASRTHAARGRAKNEHIRFDDLGMAGGERQEKKERAEKWGEFHGKECAKRARPPHSVKRVMAQFGGVQFVFLRKRG